MGNCLKTQLKEVVNNDNLEYVGFFKLEFPAAEANSNQRSFNLKLSEAATIKVLGGNFVTEDTFNIIGTEMNIDANESYRRIVVSNDACTVLLPKYTIIKLMVNLFDSWNPTGVFPNIAFMKYSPVEAISGMGNIDLSYLKDCTTLNDLSFFSSKITGNVSDLSNLVNLDIINLANSSDDYASLFTGDIADLGALIHLTEFYNARNLIGGTIESLAETQVANGRTSGSLKIYNSSGRMRYNGASFTTATITFDSHVTGGYSVATT